MQRSETADLVKQLRDALFLVDIDPECRDYAAKNQCVEAAIAAADRWLAGQPAQKPVAWITYDEYSSGSYSPPYREKRLSWHKPAKNGTPLYATPQAACGWSRMTGKSGTEEKTEHLS